MNDRPSSRLRLIDYRLARLAHTLAFARERTAFYSSLIPPGIITPSEAPEILRQLPILEPTSWDRERDKLCTRAADDAVAGFTSGTTGTPKAFYVTASELQAFRRDSDAFDGGGRLILVGLNHGPAATAMQGAGITHVPLNSARDLDRAARLIAEDGESFEGGAIEVLSGTLRQIKDLSLYMRHRYGRLDNFGIRTIEAARHMLSPRWAELLRGWWNADVVEIYGCSEMAVCNARICRCCGYYHLPPTCIGEVVNLTDPERYVHAGGRGALVVTAFSPYIEFELRIRYRPGDVVELATEPCSIWGEYGFRVLGREPYCIPIGPERKLVTPADCFEALADLSEVAIRREGVVSEELSGSNLESGSPRFSLRKEEGSLELHVELRFDPAVWAKEAEELESKIRARIDDRIAVILYRPGNLHVMYFV